MTENQQAENIVSDIYDNYHETQKEIYSIETRKTRNKLFTISAVFLIFGLLAIALSKLPFSTVIGPILIFPVIFLGLGILSIREPLAAIILGLVVVFGFWIYTAVAIDSRTMLQGWLGKALIIYLLFAGLQNAREAQRIKKELKL